MGESDLERFWNDLESDLDWFRAKFEPIRALKLISKLLSLSRG